MIHGKVFPFPTEGERRGRHAPPPSHTSSTLNSGTSRCDLSIMLHCQAAGKGARCFALDAVSGSYRHVSALDLECRLPWIFFGIRRSRPWQTWRPAGACPGSGHGGDEDRGTCVPAGGCWLASPGGAAHLALMALRRTAPATAAATTLHGCDQIRGAGGRDRAGAPIRAASLREIAHSSRSQIV